MLNSPLDSLSLKDEDSQKAEKARLDSQCSPEQLKKSLMARWRYPTLTVHKIDVSLNNPTIIPRQAEAAVSMRIVPDQDLDTICEHFKSHVERTAQALGTDNKVKASYLNPCTLLPRQY